MTTPIKNLEESIITELCTTKNEFCKSRNPEGEWNYCRNCEICLKAISQLKEEVKLLLCEKDYPYCSASGILCQKCIALKSLGVEE